MSYLITPPCISEEHAQRRLNPVQYFLKIPVNQSILQNISYSIQIFLKIWDMIEVITVTMNSYFSIIRNSSHQITTFPLNLYVS